MSPNHVSPHQDRKIFLSVPSSNSILYKRLTYPEVAIALIIFSIVSIQVLSMNKPSLIFITAGIFFIRESIIIFLFKVLLRVRPLSLGIPEEIMIFRIIFMIPLSIR